MKLRRIISLALLAVYLLLAAGPAALSLSCRCVAWDDDVRAHSCCAHARCARAAEAARAVETAASILPAPGALFFAAPCCDDRHSTEIALYTASDSESDRHVRCAVVHLPASLAAECPCPAHCPSLRRRAVERPALVPADPLPGAVGLRAPPVTV